MHRHDHERDSRGAGAHAAGVERRHQRPGHRADRRRRADQESGQAHPRRDRACRSRSPTIRWRRWSGHRQNADRFQTAAPDRDRVTELEAAWLWIPSQPLPQPDRAGGRDLAQLVLLAYQVKSKEDVR